MYQQQPQFRSKLRVIPPSRLEAIRPYCAGFWKRFAAYIIDWIILTIGGFVIGFIVGLFIAIGQSSVGIPGDALERALPSILGMVLSWLYFTAFEASSKQATPGKMALGIIVTDLEGTRISFARANGRYWSKMISGLTLGIGFIMIGFTERKQGLHDIIAGTLVLKKL